MNGPGRGGTERRLWDPGVQNERTSMAWNRTCLSYLACSLLCATLAPDEHLLADCVAVLGTAAAATLLGAAMRRYHRRAETPPDQGPVAAPAQMVALTAMTVALAMAAGILIGLSG